MKNLILTSLLFLSTLCIAQTGQITLPDGVYLHYQLAQGTHTYYMMIESGLNQPGLHTFHVPLVIPPNAPLTIKAIHGTNDYSPWCSGPAGLAYGIQINGVDYLFNDKMRIINGLEIRQDVDRVFQTPIPVSALDFNYFSDLTCIVITVSHSWILEF